MAQQGQRASPPGFIQVAFAGHNRPEDLGDPAVVARGVSAAFALLAQTGVRQASLLTGLAPGADLLAARAWRAQGLGPLHAVFPYLDSAPPEGAEALMDTGAWLDGAATEAAGRNAHLDQTRWLIGAADLLIVAWTGDQARGAGGTADAVRLALEHGIPVLWVQTEAGALRLIEPELLDEDFGFLEFLEQLRVERAPLVCPATAEILARRLDEIGAEASAELAKTAAPPPPPLPRIWQAYAMFRRTLGGAAARHAPVAPPADLGAQRGFAALSRAQADADETASRLGAIHRSQQLILLLIAIVAAVVGSAPALWHDLKLPCVIAELALALIALGLWRDSDRRERPHRWNVARSVAEDLRLQRVAWAFGVSAGRDRHRGAPAGPALELRKRCGLPEGRFDAARVSAWGCWAIDELIAGQIAYHRAQAVINGRVMHRVHAAENLSFLALMAVLASYIVAAAAMAAWGHEPPHWLGGLVFMAGSIVPAIGAASLALDATLSLREQAQRSDVLAARLEAVRERLGPQPDLQGTQSAIRAAMRLMRAQEDHWAEASVRRKLYRGG